MAKLAKAFGEVLSWIIITLMVTLTIVVIVAVIYRKTGYSLSWYDEVASILLAWVTYFGAAYAALRRSHIGFDGVLFLIPMPWRLYIAYVAEVLVIGFFILLAWAGWTILQVLEGSTLVSLTWVPVQLTQSIIPIGAVLFIIAELLSIPDYMKNVAAGVSSEHPTMEDVIEDELSKQDGPSEKSGASKNGGDR